MMHLQATSRRPVMLYLDGLALGGVERIVLNLADGLGRDGWEVHLALNRAQGDLLRDVPAATRVHDLDAGKFLLAVTKLAQSIRRVRPGILLSQRAYLNTIAILAAQLAGGSTRVVLAEHSMLSKWLRDPHAPKRAVDRILPYVLPAFYSKAAAVVGVSRGVAADLEGILGCPADRILVLQNPILPAFAPESDLPLERSSPPMIVGMGRLSPEKGFDLLLQAFRTVLGQRPARLAIVGRGDALPRLQGLAEELGVADQVLFPGFQPEPRVWLRSASIFALSSHLESFPTVVVEAMAEGTPVVAFDCPEGPREIITHREDGLLVPLEDPAALAAGILEVLGDPRLADKLRAGGRARAQSFTYDGTIAAYSRLFESLAAAS